MTMRRVLLVGQDKGGSGKSLVVRALAESVVTARIVELEDEKRLVELDDRVDFFPVRAERSEIDRTSGAAARSEYDAVIDLMARRPAEGTTMPEPLIVDIGANASRSFLPEVASRAARYGRIGVEFAMLTVITAEPGASSSAPVVLDLARPFAKPLFAIENQIEGPVDAKILKSLGKDVVLRRLARLTLDPKANELLQKGGLRFIADRLEEAEDSLSERFGFAAAGRIIQDLTAFRAQAMAAVAPMAEWLEKGA
ncbi:hypothetical protein [Lichenibacterium dinghuense]|jgi:hypothetical protein|uniref:hypothetical protein n=1 Tax=Lichenibacterium dinghuense TaxID=2895977 RepID=UPI001F3594A8|nr:hypothetical protein [Lichenibacterium sp. 6Y81]